MPETNLIPNVRQRFLGGVAWVTASRVVIAAIGVATTFVLARLLTPAEFGIFAMATVFVGIAHQARDFGVGQALVQLEEVNEESQKIAFTYAFASSAVIYVILFALAVPIARFYGNPEVAKIVRVLALSFPVAAFAVVPSALLRRDLTLRGEAVAMSLATLIESVITIALAVLGWRHWALVAGKLVGVVATTLLISVARPWRVGILFRASEGRRILKFGGGVTASSLLWYAYSNADFVIVGRVLGSSALGVYTMAWNLAKMPWDRLWASVSPLVLPLFARSRSDPQQLGRVLRSVTRHLSLIMFPAVAGLAVVAPEVVNVILGDQWSGAKIPIILFCVLGVVRGVAILWGPVLMASGRVSSAVRFNLACALSLPIGFWVATRWGIIGVAWVWVLVYPLLAVAWLLPQALALARVSASEYFSELTRPAAATALMVGIVLLARQVIPFSGVPLLASLIALGVISYALSARLLLGPILETLRGLLADTREGFRA